MWGFRYHLHLRTIACSKCHLVTRRIDAAYFHSHATLLSDVKQVLGRNAIDVEKDCGRTLGESVVFKGDQGRESGCVIQMHHPTYRSSDARTHVTPEEVKFTILSFRVLCRQVYKADYNHPITTRVEKEKWTPCFLRIHC